MRAKFIIDIILAFGLLLAASPFLAVAMLCVWVGDFKAPVYFAERVGKNHRRFRMVKIRTMVPGADRSSVISTGASDSRITRAGRVIRALKLDEVLQLVNVLKGDMYLVGPRPNTWRKGAELYTETERRLLTVKPGITDFSSIVFADEGAILTGHADPDLAYNQLIRPWKSRLGLLYIDKQSRWLDLKLIFWTALSLVSRRAALDQVCACLTHLGAPASVIEVCTRSGELRPAPPPGSDEIAQALP